MMPQCVGLIRALVDLRVGLGLDLRRSPEGVDVASGAAALLHPITQPRTYMYLLRTAHLGEVSVTVWPRILKDMGAKRNIHVLE